MTSKHSRSTVALIVFGLIAGLVLPSLPAPLAPLVPLAPEAAMAQGEVTYPPFTPDSAITNMKVVALDDEPDSNPCGSGWKWIDVDLNKWAGGDWIYFCYQEGAPGGAITDIKFIRNTTDCGTGYTRDSTDLNKGAGGDDIYLCYRKGGALPVIKLDVVTGITPLVACRSAGGSWTKEPTDLNADAGGLYVYLCFVDLAGESGLDNCGNEGEGPCTFLSTFFWENGSGVCDRGLRQAGDECINGLGDHARYNQGDEVLAFQDSWTLWALQNQRKQLAWNEPLTSVMHIGAHNAFNNTADGYILSNQTYSITDMLRAGVRLIELDVHSGTPHLTGTYPQLCHAGGAGRHVGCVVGDRDFYNAIKEIRHWMIQPENADEVVILFLEAYVDDEDEDFVAGVLDLYLGGSDIGLYTNTDWVADGSSSLPSQAELVAEGKRVIPYTNQNTIDPLIRDGSIGSTQTSITDIGSKLDTDNCEFNGNIDPTFRNFVRVYDNRIAGGAGGTERRVTPDELADFAKCNITLIDIDDILDYDDDDTRGDRLKSAIWSWAEGVRGQPGEAAFINSADNRWHGDEPDTAYRYVCLDDDNTGTTAITSTEFGDILWRVTAATGPFGDGIATCEAEFPGSTFNAPRNGYQNALLNEVPALDDASAWLNYHDINSDGWWGSLPTSTFTGPTTVVEGSVAEYSVMLDIDAEIIDATCGDGVPEAVGLPDDLVGDTVSANQEVTFKCLFPDGPATSTIQWTFDDPNAADDLVMQQSVTITNASPSVLAPRISTVTVDEDTEYDEFYFLVWDAGGVGLADGSGREDLTVRIDWGDGTAEPVTLFEDWKYADSQAFRGVPRYTMQTSYYESADPSFIMVIPPHVWDTPGSYDMVVTACDKDSACDTRQVYNVDVVNITGSIDSMPDDAILNEGGTFSGTATISVPDNGDIYWTEIDYGDGSIVPDEGVAPSDTTVDLSHTYADNGIYTVEIKICDEDGDCSGTESMTVTVNNVAPILTAVDDFTIDEGESTTWTLARFTDPGFDCLLPDCKPQILEDFTGTISWGDGTSGPGTVIETLSYTATNGTVSGSHSYADEGTYTVTVWVRDDDEGEADPVSLTITVENVAPTVDTPVIDPAPSSEGDAVELTAAFSDPGGSADGPYTCQISWGDETTTDGIFDGMTCMGSHTYADDHSSDGYPVTVTVADKDGGSGSNTVDQTVSNVAPSVNTPVVSPAPSNEGDEVELTTSFSDPAGSGDGPFTCQINWGDETTTDGTLDGMTCLGSHTFADDNSSDGYSIEVTVADKDGGSGSSNVTHTVNNVAPTLTNVNVATINEAGTATLSGTIGDPGVNDSFTLVIDWGDGSTSETFTYPSGTTSFSETHQYLDDNPSGSSSDIYTVSLTLSDKDNASTSTSVEQTVDNVAPTIAEIIVPAISEHRALVQVSVAASDPAGGNDPLTYAFDCDGNGTFERRTGASNSAMCLLDPTTVSPDVGVRVSDDDLGVTTQTITLAVVKHLCRQQGSGMLYAWNAEEGCSGPQQEIVISGSAPLNLCMKANNDQLKASESCSSGWDSYSAPGPDAIQVCYSESNGKLRRLPIGEECKPSEVADLIPAQ